MGRKVILYIAMSLDGYIAKKDDNFDFLKIVDRPNEDFGYGEFLETIDTVIWGRRTFDIVLAMGNGILHQNKAVFVISKSRTGTEGHAVYKDNPLELINDLRKQEGKDIYCDGGSELVDFLFKHQLVNRVIVSVIPHLLGDGIRLFKNGRPEQYLSYKRSISYPSGLVQLWYDVNETS
ncbi:dihydrofolate reductase family protein [Pedobacter immunditicola]|uniref:dihydrofolate reductase family protein n=1 Tax=Pedobacter immunditicola TaxID=3133440 RepID=UPI0030976D96